MHLGRGRGRGSELPSIEYANWSSWFAADKATTAEPVKLSLLPLRRVARSLVPVMLQQGDLRRLLPHRKQQREMLMLFRRASSTSGETISSNASTERTIGIAPPPILAGVLCCRASRMHSDSVLQCRASLLLPVRRYRS
jgi:hypothetical protein